MASTTSISPETNSTPNCPSDGELQAFVECEHRDEKQTRLSLHIAECERCGSRVTNLLANCETFRNAMKLDNGSSVGRDDATAMQDLAWIAKQVAEQGDDEQTPQNEEHPQPTRIGRFIIKATIGAGSFGTVFLAQDPVIDREVAIKVPRPGRLSRDDSVEQFLLEARAAGRLDHPGIVSIYDAVRLSLTENQEIPCYVVMQFVPGVTLDRIVSHQTPSFHQTALIVFRIAKALAHAHEHGIVHRDMKPSNVMIDHSGNPLISDFGLSLKPSAESPTDIPTYAGTPNYMAPEQMLGETHRIDGRTDLWSLGVVFYRLLTGERPFTGKGEKLRDAVLHQAPRTPTEIDANVPRGLERICLRCLSKRMVERYSSAKELIADLEAWLADGDTASQPVQIRPRGLLCFEARDANAYLTLVPGLRDRHGIPNSLNQWQSCLEAPDSSSRYPVKLLFGPCGSGKSSFIKAGVLPRLSALFRTLTFTATDGQTSAAIQKRLTRIWPQMEKVSLTEALGQLRRDILPVTGEKLLIVIDQFEQALVSQPDENLVQALRQCDGVNVQALLIVRDEFWLTVTEFFGLIEVPLAVGENCFAIDLFSNDHAKGVLTTLGMAYGKLGVEGAAINASQKQFLEMAVDELASEGCVIPVQLAILSATLSDQEWTAQSFRDLGGSAGSAAAYLHKAFQNSFPTSAYAKKHEGAHRVLRALVSDESNLKRSGETYEKLFLESGYTKKERAAFDQLIKTLDAELRLITPVQPSVDVMAGEQSSQDQNTRYQVTHDFLVPAIKGWLDKTERSSPAGRARLMLRERSAAWGIKQDSRQLPSVPDWLRIQRHVPKTNRTKPEQRMMRTKSRRILTAFAMGCVLCSLLAWGTSSIMRSMRVDSTVDQLLHAALTDVPEILRSVRQLPNEYAPKLEAAWDDTESVQSDDVLHRRRLRLAMATLDNEPQRAELVMAALMEAGPDENEPLAMALSRSPDSKSELWNRLEKATGVRALRIASCLALMQPKSMRWSANADRVTLALIQSRPDELASWTEQLRPIGAYLRPSVMHTLSSTSGLSEIEQTNQANIVVSLFADQPTSFASAVSLATSTQLPAYVSAIEPGTSDLALALDANCDRVSDYLASKSTLEPVLFSDSTTRLISENGGAISASGAFVTQLAMAEVPSTLRTFAAKGYFPTTIRPYSKNGNVRAAVGWKRQAKGQFEFREDLTPANVQEYSDKLPDRALQLSDISWYESNGTTHFCALAREVTGDQATELVLDATFPEHDEECLRRYQSNQAMLRLVTRLGADGSPRLTSIWRKDANAYATNCQTMTRQLGRIDDDLLGQAHYDCQLHEINPALRDDYLTHQCVTVGLEGLKPTDDIRAVHKSRAMIFLERHSESLPILDEALQRFPGHAGLTATRARAFIELQEFDEAADDVQTLLDLEPSGRFTDTLLLRQAVHEEESEEVARLIQRIEGRWEEADDDYTLFALLRASAIAAEMEGDYAERAFELIGRPLPASYALILIRDPDFDPLRSDRRFQKAIAKYGFTTRASVVGLPAASMETKWLLNLSWDQHELEAQRLLKEGWYPNAIATSSDPVYPTDDLIISIWHRDLTAVETKEGGARQLANLAIATWKNGNFDIFRRVADQAWGAECQSRLIQLASSDCIPIETVLAELQASDNDIRTRAMLLMLATMDPPENMKHLRKVNTMQRALNRSATVRSAARYCIHAWREAASGDSSVEDSGEKSPANYVAKSESRGSDWHVNRLNQIMVELSPSSDYIVGSPGWERGRGASEAQYHVQIGRFAIADTETTVEQFSKYLDSAQARDAYKRRRFTFSTEFAPSPHCPQIGTTYLDAARFCQWLSEYEGIPESEWCYPGIWESSLESYQIPEDFLQRKGYRLPTEAEWEFAARGGCPDARYFGTSDGSMDLFEWTSRNSNDSTQRVATRFPNPFGLFDMLGNARELAHDPYVDKPYQARESPENRQIFQAPHPIRGSDFASAIRNARAATRHRLSSYGRHFSTGFRIARSLENQ